MSEIIASVCLGPTLDPAQLTSWEKKLMQNHHHGPSRQGDHFTRRALIVALECTRHRFRGAETKICERPWLAYLCVAIMALETDVQSVWRKASPFFCFFVVFGLAVVATRLQKRHHR